MNIVLFSLPLLLVATMSSVCSGQGINQFWYTDKDDLISGKKPDISVTGPGGPDIGTTDSPITDKEEPDSEKIIDQVRGSVQPGASDMNKVTWDKDLEKDSKDSAKRCDGGSLNKAGVGSIVTASTKRMSYREALLLAIDGGKDYDYATNRCKKPNSMPCENYKLLVSASVTGYACSRSHCPGTALPYRVHCVFSPKPTGGDKPFTKGTPCQLCPKDRGYCYNRMCVSDGLKKQILTKKPTSNVTCDAPCMNCGERKDVANICSCHCRSGYSGLDCSSGSSSKPLYCGSCKKHGTPCLNGGLDSGKDICQCLCPRGFVGNRCELPTDLVEGGVVVPVVEPEICVGCGKTPPDETKLDDIIKDLKDEVAKETNKYCTKNQQNYIKCCGTGTLPTSGAMDFVDPSNVHVTKPVTYSKNGRLLARTYALVKGNNGLCRKTTEEPPPMVPVPGDVVKDAINKKVPNLKLPCCGVTVEKVNDTVSDIVGGKVSSLINCLVVSLV